MPPVNLDPLVVDGGEDVEITKNDESFIRSTEDNEKREDKEMPMAEKTRNEEPFPRYNPRNQKVLPTSLLTFGIISSLIITISAQYYVRPSANTEKLIK